MQRTTIFAFLTAASLVACFVDNDPDPSGSSGVGPTSGSGGTTSVTTTSTSASTSDASSTTTTASSTGTGVTTGCDALCANATPIHLGCVEGGFEELGFTFDAPSCNEYENSVGLPGACLLFTQCQSVEGFSDAECDMVAAVCL